MRPLERLFFLFLVQLAPLLSRGQVEIGYRWAKPWPGGTDTDRPLSARKGTLYSIEPYKICRYDSLGNVTASYSIAALPEPYYPVCFSVLNHQENFLVRTSTPPPICVVGGVTTITWEKLLKPAPSPDYMRFMYQTGWEEPGGFGTGSSEGELFENTLISPGDYLFSKVSPYSFSGADGLYNHVFQLADTNLAVRWRKKIRSGVNSRSIGIPTDDNRFLITLITDSTVQVDSGNAIQVTQPSLVHLYFDPSGLLVYFKTVPATIDPAGQVFLQKDQSLFILRQIEDNTMPLGYTRPVVQYRDASGVLRWEKVFNSSGRFSNLVSLSADDAGNVLCYFSDYSISESSRSPSFVVMSIQGQVLWADSSLQHTYYFSEYSQPVQNLGTLNWAVQMFATDSMNIGPFHQPLPLYQKAFLVNIKGISPLTLSSADRYCTSDHPEVTILNPRVNGIAGADTFYVYLSDSAGNFASQTLVGQGTTPKVRVAFPPTLPAGSEYRFRVFSLAGSLYGPASAPVRICPSPARPVITSATGSFTTCRHTPLLLSTTPSLAEYVWSTGQTGTQTVAIPDGFHYVTAVLGGCEVRSDTVLIRGIRDEVNFLFAESHCNANQPIRLGVQPDSGFWSGPQLDSTHLYFLPQPVSDTVVLRYRDNTSAQCPIDTLARIYQLVRPMLPQLADTVVCQQARKIALPKVPGFEVEWYQNFTWSLNDSLWLGNDGDLALRYTAGPYGCSASGEMHVNILPASLSPCFGLDTMADYTYYVKPKNCTPTEYFTHVKVSTNLIRSATRFQVQLSDSSGQFVNPVILGESSSPLFTLSFPVGISGSHFKTRLKIMGSDTVLSTPAEDISVYATPAPPAIQHLGPTSRCITDMQPPTRFYLDKGYDYQWFPGNISGDTLVPIPGTMYRASASNHGCTSYWSEGKQVTMQTPTLAHMTSPTNLCTPLNPFYLQVNSSASGLWTGPQVDSTTGWFYPTNEDDTLVIRYRHHINGSACLTDTTFTLYQLKKPTFPASSSVYVCQNAGLYPLPYPTQHVVWTGPGLVNQNQYNPATTVGQHIIQGTASHGFCVAGTKVYFNVRDSLSAACMATEMQELSATEKEMVYPNPAEDYIQVKAPLPIQRIRVTDALGRTKVEASDSMALPENGLFDVSAWVPGVYWIHIQTMEGTTMRKVVKR